MQNITGQYGAALETLKGLEGENVTIYFKGATDLSSVLKNVITGNVVNEGGAYHIKRGGKSLRVISVEEAAEISSIIQCGKGPLYVEPFEDAPVINTLW